MKKFRKVPAEASAESVEVPTVVPADPIKNPLEAPTGPMEVLPSPPAAPVGKTKTVRVSEKKLAANRRNAQKSTGPKTPRGKANSRRNAIKDGLFAMELSLEDLRGREDPKKYQKHLREQYRYFKPVGRAEENEVALMCASWCMRDRAWRCLNATVFSSQCHIAHCEEQKNAERQTCIDRLRAARAEVEARGDMSAELWEKIWAYDGFKEMWEAIESKVRKPSAEGLAGPESKEDMAERDLDRDEYLEAIDRAILYLQEELKVGEKVWNIHYDLKALPKTEELDRILRATSAFDRDISRAIDRLERLQRSRKGGSGSSPCEL